jgi:hypothetical protein
LEAMGRSLVVFFFADCLFEVSSLWECEYGLSQAVSIRSIADRSANMHNEACSSGAI